MLFTPFRTTNTVYTSTMSMNRYTKKANSFSALKRDQLSMANAIMRALAHPLRIKILASIDEKGAACVHEIYEALDIEQSVASQQLRILRLAGLVSPRRDGKFIYYEVDYEKVASVVAATDRCNEAAPPVEKPRTRIVRREPVMAPMAQAV